ncbi:UNVERIFIED_CONTAM: hypothetical protein FKN15_042983 [Acipenser sinensis]
MAPVPAQAYGNFFEGDCYIVLCGRQSSSQLLFDVHYWIGSQSSQDEQGAAAILVTQLDNYLGGSPIQYREVQDCESVKFKSYFKNGIVYKKGGLASGFKHVETNMYNIKRLLHVKGRKNFSATEVDVSWNSFNVGDIFLLDMGKVIVQWNGPESNHPERLKDCYIVDQGGVKIFVWKGKNATTQERQAALGRAEVWRIEELELKEVDPSTYGQFYGGDCYLVLYTYSRGQKPHYILYMWQGCSGDERERAKNVADIVSKRDKQTILEGQEPADFWVALGGKAPYCSDKRFQEEKPQRVPRLFECSNQTGRFMMTEVFDFAQEDLDEEDVMLLDTWEEIFLWIGKAANDVEKKESLTSAAEYLKTHPAQRDPGTPVTTVTQGHEPLTFTGWFSAWDPHKWSDSRSYEDIKNSLGDASAISQITVDLNKTDLNRGKGGASKSPASGYSAPGGPSTPLNTATKNKPHSVRTDKTDGRSPAADSGRTTGYDPELLVNKTAEELPEGVDPSRKEDFLSDADFENLLGTTRSEFSTMPAWRQKHLKKTSGLF